MSDFLLEVRDLKQYFHLSGGALLRAVDGVSFNIAHGQTLGLVGESGCGKTTVGRSILRLYRPSSGEVLFEGEPVDDRSIGRLRRKMQMVFQDPYSSLDPRMTVGDIIAEPLIVHRLFRDRRERRRRVLELMELVGLNSEHAGRHAHEFSGGQRQRIGIARALAVEPKFIVCDEAVSALDVSIQAQIVNMFCDLQEKLGVAYLFIAHDLLIVRHVSDRIAVMYLGKIVEIGSAEQVCDAPVHPYTRSLLAAVPLPDPKRERQREHVLLHGEIPSPLNIPDGCAFRTRCPYASERCEREYPPLAERDEGHFAACWNK